MTEDHLVYHSLMNESKRVAVDLDKRGFLVRWHRLVRPGVRRHDCGLINSVLCPSRAASGPSVVGATLARSPEDRVGTEQSAWRHGIRSVYGFLPSPGLRPPFFSARPTQGVSIPRGRSSGLESDESAYAVSPRLHPERRTRRVASRTQDPEESLPLLQGPSEPRIHRKDSRITITLRKTFGRQTARLAKHLTQREAYIPFLTR